MRIALRCLSGLLPLLIASSISAVSMAWTPIGNPGNTCDPQPTSQSGTAGGCFGSVAHYYSIGTYEVTNAQYAEFLNAKAAADPLLLYNPAMSTWGITRSGVAGNYSYTVIAGHEEMPVNVVTWYDAVRFANWMANGQGTGDTETGAYTLLGGTAVPSNGTMVTRNEGASIFLASEDEWYKAAYFDPATSSYFDYPTGSNTAPTCGAPTATPNHANCAVVPPAVGLSDVGSYSGSASPYGTFDQGGNLAEWNDTRIIERATAVFRGVRGGSTYDDSLVLASSWRDRDDARLPNSRYGFRLVMVPEPGTGLLVFAGLLGLAGWRRAYA